MKELTELINTIHNDHPQAPPQEIARRVARVASDHQVRLFLEEAVAPLVANIVRHARNTAIDQVLRPSGTLSVKVAGYRRWAQMLEELIPTKEGYKQLGDCTVKDLDFAIEERRRQIERIEGRIRDLTLLREHMIKHHANILRQAPEIVI